ncbi:MAG TPA: ribose 5-phosphate isomerase B [Nitrospirota bacterium]|nr:ribose 5-phosphate isomerase B [Nitrospirota bacterium]
MKVALGCDHGGLELKLVYEGVLKSLGVEVLDMGAMGEESVDYPDYASKVAEAVSTGAADRGVAVCGTGIGMAIVANKYPNVRAALCHDAFTARMSRAHNDANILVLGGRVTGREVAVEILKLWLATPFEGGRHQRRLDKIAEIEKKVCK